MPIFSSIMAGLGTAASLAGTAMSAIQSIKNNRDEQAKLDAYNAEQRAGNESFYNKQIYQDPTRRADNVAMQGMLDRRLKRQEEVNEGKMRVAGGTNEQRLANRQIAADQTSQLLANQAAAQSARMDKLTDAQHQERRAIDETAFQRQNAIDQQRATNAATLANNAAQLGSAALLSFGQIGIGDTKDKKIKSSQPSTKTL